MKLNPSTHPPITGTPPGDTASRNSPGRDRPLSGLVARYPVASFLLIALPLSLALMTVPVLAQFDRIPGKGPPAPPAWTWRKPPASC
jgi:hypothetical protein